MKKVAAKRKPTVIKKAKRPFKIGQMTKWLAAYSKTATGKSGIHFRYFMSRTEAVTWLNTHRGYKQIHKIDYTLVKSFANV